MLPPEAQGVGSEILGVSAILTDFREIVLGRSTLKWYDQALHVVGAFIVLGIVIGGAIELIIQDLAK